MPTETEQLEDLRKVRALLREALKEDVFDKVEKIEKLEADLAKKHDALVALQQEKTNLEARVTELDGKFRLFMEKSSRPPGSGGPAVIEPPPNWARLAVESDAFKGASWNGNFKVSTTVKSRIRGMNLKAAPPTITEGPPIVITPPGAPASGYPIFPYRVGLIPQPFPRIVMRDVLDVVPLDGTNAVEYVREAWTLNADYQVNEGDKKAQSGVSYTEYTAPVRTIAHFVKVSRQMAADVPMIMGSIEQKVSIGVLQKEDRELLYGDNSAGHLWGIMPQATPVGTYAPGTPPTTITSLDQLLAAISYIQSIQYYEPTAIVLNPIDLSKLLMMKNSLGGYILAGSPYDTGIPRLWGLPVVTTPHMNQGDFLLGAFPGNAILFDRESVTVEIAFQNEDDFVRNLVTIRAEERVAFAVTVPQAFCKGPFNTLPLSNVSGPYLTEIVTGEHAATPAPTHKAK